MAGQERGLWAAEPTSVTADAQHVRQSRRSALQAKRVMMPRPRVRAVGVNVCAACLARGTMEAWGRSVTGRGAA